MKSIRQLLGKLFFAVPYPKTSVRAKELPPNLVQSINQAVEAVKGFNTVMGSMEKQSLLSWRREIDGVFYGALRSEPNTTLFAIARHPEVNGYYFLTGAFAPDRWERERNPVSLGAAKILAESLMVGWVSKQGDHILRQSLV
jgi:hypothetical protein